MYGNSTYLSQNLFVFKSNLIRRLQSLSFVCIFIFSLVITLSWAGQVESSVFAPLVTSPLGIWSLFSLVTPSLVCGEGPVVALLVTPLLSCGGSLVSGLLAGDNSSWL